MEIVVDKDTLIFFHEILTDLYRNTADPITLGYSESLVHACAERPFTDIYRFIPFPHTLHKAAVLMDTLIRFHPFIDGNKRVALLSTFCFLYWNGYNLRIPEDAAQFTVEIAEGKHAINDVLQWIVRYSKRNVFTILRSLLLSVLLPPEEEEGEEERALDVFTTPLLVPMFLPSYPFRYFRYLIAKKAKRTQQKA